MQIRLTQAQVADLAILREAEMSAWTAAITKARTLPPHPMEADVLRAVLCEVADTAFIETLLRQSLSMLGMMLQLNLRSAEVFEALRAALEKPPAEWNEDQLNRWSERHGLFRDLLEVDAVVGTAKAMDLNYEHEHLLRRARILTDIRPVFDRKGDQIQGTVISHTLRIRYDTLASESSISLALDRNDVENLLEECKRALKKSQLSQAFVANAGFPALSPGSNA